MSINRIVKDAGIPRGSYYQYFKNKQDLYGFVLEDLRSALMQNVACALTANGGDLFCALLTAYDGAAQYAKTQESAVLFANLLVGFGEKCRPTPGRLLTGSTEAIFDAIDRTRLREDAAESLDELVELSFLVFISALAELFLDITRAELLRKKLQTRLHLIQFGALDAPDMPEDCPHAC